jgi:hypothetical protein
VPLLPLFNPATQINHSPHVVILGAGASRAAFPKGDANGKRLPVMADLIELLGLAPAIADAGFSDTSDFESLYDEIATSGKAPGLKAEIEAKVEAYFAALQLPESPTLYDYLILSLRESDYIATFNWDPFLAQASRRSRQSARVPKLLFLHGNVEVGLCPVDRVKGFRGDNCQKCGAPLQPSRLLYPVRQKNYNSDPFIEGEWKELESALVRGYMLTIFGYSAPKTDVEAVGLMLRGWGANPTFELAQVSIVDIKPESELETTWERFFCRTHYGTTTSVWNSWLFRHPRRSGEALAMATLQNDPWHDNPFPKLRSLSQVHAWLAPLIVEEEAGRFTGNPCLQPEDFSEEPPPEPKKIGIDQVLGWLKVICRGGGIIPPFCVEVVLKDGARYSLHSVLDCDEETRTMCFRIWDLRALSEADVAALKQTLNGIRDREELAPVEKVHPKLDWANVRVHYDDVSYCVEWHDRIWPKE